MTYLLVPTPRGNVYVDLDAEHGNLDEEDFKHFTEHVQCWQFQARIVLAAHHGIEVPENALVSVSCGEVCLDVDHLVVPEPVILSLPDRTRLRWDGLVERVQYGVLHVLGVLSYAVGRFGPEKVVTKILARLDR
jgi:hypothetical protein